MITAIGTVTAAPIAASDLADGIVRHVTVVDVERGRDKADQAVAWRDGTIVAVGADAAIARRWQTAKVVEGRGRYLIPGLWDMHVHFGGGPDLVQENEALLPLYVANGITTIRDCSGDLPEQVLAWRDAIARGTLFGPRLLTSGAKLEGLRPIWKGTIEVGTKADVDAAIAHEKRVGVDFVKITDSTLDPELFLYAVSRARAADLRVSGHIPMQLTVGQAVDAGISSIEHLDYAYKAGVKDEAAIAADFAAGRIDRTEANRRIDVGFDPATAMRAYRRLAASNVFVTPTLNISEITAHLDEKRHEDDPYLAYIGPGLRRTYDWRVKRAAGATPGEIDRRHARFDRVAAILPMLRRAGVTIMAGTDAGFLNSFDYPGVGLHDELALYVKYGLTPAQALASATRAGPAWFGELGRYGAIAPGKAADLVLLDGNPLRSISATRQIQTVVLRGRMYDRAGLDAMLSSTRAKVAGWNKADQIRRR
ncbi:amidohydrolase family protein [Sphingomonas sp. 1P08PE]|uniref:amidohydrolase family protein n=1 Tax=Sphingomonas sp. 1P08PE TaxID=554122 RepID=UPI0039A32658